MFCCFLLVQLRCQVVLAFRFSPVSRMGINEPKCSYASSVAQNARVDCPTRVGKATCPWGAKAMDGSSGLAIFGMGHNTPPGVHGRSGVLQCMLRFATESKGKEEKRNAWQDGTDRGTGVESAGSNMEGERKNGRAEKGEGEHQIKARLARTRLGWNKALWIKHIWSKNRRSTRAKARDGGRGLRAEFARKSRAERISITRRMVEAASPLPRRSGL